MAVSIAASKKPFWCMKNHYRNGNWLVHTPDPMFPHMGMTSVFTNGRRALEFLDWAVTWYSTYEQVSVAGGASASASGASQAGDSASGPVPESAD